MQMAKRCAALLLAGLLVPGLAGCKKDETSSTGSSPTKVTLKVWGAQEDQALLEKMVSEFKKAHPDKTYDITFGVVGEIDVKTKFLEDPDAAADVFSFPNDQMNELIKAGALYQITRNTEKIESENSKGSVEACKSGDKLYAYPMTADNGYFLYYDKSAITQEQVKSLDGILQAAQAAGKKVVINMKEPWYMAGFFVGAGCTIGRDESGKQICDLNNETGVKVGEALRQIVANPAFLNGDDSVFDANIGTNAIAGITGAWKADSAMEKLGDNYAATKLPTFTVDGKQVQMGSFAGYKQIGINKKTKFPVDAMELAEWLTNEENQMLRFKERALGPSNIKVAESEAVKANQALAALSAQSEYAVSQAEISDDFWLPAKAYAETLVSKDTSKSVKQQLDDMVAQVGK